MGNQKAKQSLVPEGISPNEWVNYCWSDMRRRWSLREQVYVEDYLPATLRNRLPSSALVDLIYAEYILRKEHGPAPRHEEFVTRFPQLESELRRQFAVDDALSSDLLGEFESTLTSHSDESLVETPEPLERIGKYVVITRVGGGGQAEIYRAVHPGLGKEVVIKIGKSVPAMAARKEQLEAEARILAGIDHPNLARIYDLDVFQDRPFLVMEFIRGLTLEQYVRQEDPSPRDAAALLAKVARGLAAVHKRGVVHLDIKPSNVLIDENSEPRLIDFGLAHLADAWHDDVLDSGSVRGTLHFMSPEQALGQAAKIDFRSDIFGLGGLLFFLLTKTTPYPRGSFSELLERVRDCDWDQERLYRREIPHGLRQCCLKAMDRNSEKRFPTADALAKRLEQCSRGRRRLTPYLLAVTAALVVVVAVAAVSSGWITFGRQNGVVPSIAASQGEFQRQRASQPSTADIDPHLGIEVWESDRYLQLRDTAPVRNDDQLRMTATIPQGQYYSLLLLNSEGELQQLAQGRADRPSTIVRYPTQAGQAVPLVGTPGTEVVLICGSRSGPIAIDQVRKAWSRTEPLPQLPEFSVLRAGPGGVTVDQQGRGFGTPVDRPDPESVVQTQLASFGRALGQQVEFFEAVAFCHQP